MTEQEVGGVLQEYEISTSSEPRADGRITWFAWYNELPFCLAEAADRDAAISELKHIAVPFVLGMLKDGGEMPTPARHRGRVVTQIHQISQVVLGDVQKLLNAQQLNDSQSEAVTPNRFNRQGANGNLVAV